MPAIKYQNKLGHTRWQPVTKQGFAMWFALDDGDRFYFWKREKRGYPVLYWWEWYAKFRAWVHDPTNPDKNTWFKVEE